MPNSKTKTIQIVAGPNGSGKTTFASAYLLANQNRITYLNPDRIAAGIAPFDFEKASFQAGKVLIREVKTLIQSGKSFAFESTLSGRTWLNIIKAAIDQGYSVTIYYLYLKNISQNLNRIKKRVQMGGHPIPSLAVRRRHPRCFDNFWNLYRPLCIDWYIFDNSEAKPILIQNQLNFKTLDESAKQKFVASFLRGRFL